MHSRHFLLALGLVLASSACNSNDSTPATGPIDGTYVQDSEDCGGPIPSSVGSTLTVADTSWTFVHAPKSDGCVVTDYSTVSYSNGTLLSIQHEKTCSATCTSGECMANTTAQPTCDGTYSLNGTSLNITITNADCGTSNGCVSNGTDINILTKQ
jgi:hypothetical protein